VPLQSRAQKLRQLSNTLIAAQKPVRVLKAISWPERVRTRFLEGRLDAVPEVEYAPLAFDAVKRDQMFRDVEQRCDGRDPLQALLCDIAQQYRRVIAMLRARGKPSFARHSRVLYGTSDEAFLGGPKTNLDLAEHLLQRLHAQPLERLRRGAAQPLSAAETAAQLETRFEGFFGRGVVKVEVSTDLTADAAAGASKVRIRRGGHFSRATLDYLEQHEGYVHIATSLNGSRQPVLGILGKASPRAVKHNEGLAVFAEWASGTLTADRLRTLAERVRLVHMAEQGADFMEVYRHVLGLGRPAEQAFEQAHRVFRGGSPRGGSFFTKDTSYLDHFMRTFDFFRALMLHGRPDLGELLFAGKVAIEDLPALMEARREGLLEPPQYLPPWLAQPDWLAAHLSLSSFFNQLDVGAVAAYYETLFRRCEVVAPLETVTRRVASEPPPRRRRGGVSRRSGALA
jgi:uncharacterized protein (TIGR02421 family)